MIRGIKFEVPNQWFPVFSFVLGNIDIKKYFWFLAGEDVIGNRGYSGYFGKYRYPGSEFEQAIQNEDCYAVSVNLQAFPKEDDISEIHSYQDFENSKCEILFLIDDNSYIYMYIKDPEVLNIIRDTAIANQYENIDYITDENNSDNLEWL